MHEIVVHEDADSELNNAAAFYQSRQEGLGDQFLGEVASSFRRISPIRSLAPLFLVSSIGT